MAVEVVQLLQLLVWYERIIRSSINNQDQGSRLDDG